MAEEPKTTSGARFLCVHCDHRFVHEGDDEARCPKCMRKNGLEAVAEPKQVDVQKRTRVLLIAAAGVLLAIGVGYAVWARTRPIAVEGDVPLRPLSAEELRAYLTREHAESGTFEELLVADEAVRAFAEDALEGSGSPVERASRLTKAIRAHASARAFVPWSFASPREAPLFSPARIVEKLGRDGGRATLYPLEVAAVTAAALRDAGVEAMVAEVFRYPSERTPPDPSGRVGYFAVVVYDGAAGHGTPRFVDPYGGRTSTPEEDGYRVLTDVQVVAAALGIDALHALVHTGEAPRALERIQKALRLDPRSPYLRTARAAILVAAGGLEEGVSELESAAQIRPDAPRRNNLGAVYLAQGEIEDASREVEAALDSHPDFAGAHATRGALYLASSDFDRARAELERAEQLEPDLFLLPMLWADYHLRSGDPETAARYAAEGVRRRPHDLQARLGAAQVYRAAGKYDEMRREARAALEMAPAGQEAALREQILAVLGPTAFDPLEDELDEDELAEGEEDEGALPGGDFQLGGGALLGGDPPEGGRPLLGGEESGGPALMLGDPSKLRLRPEGEQLRLDIGE